MTTTVQQDGQLADFAVLAYNKDGLLPNGQPPEGWRQIDDGTNGSFAAFAYQNLSTGQIVIAYRGVDGLNDAAASTAIFLGRWSSQFEQAARFTASIRNRFGDNILVTGHSLGGE